MYMLLTAKMRRKKNPIAQIQGGRPSLWVVEAKKQNSAHRYTKTWCQTSWLVNSVLQWSRSRWSESMKATHQNFRTSKFVNSPWQAVAVALLGFSCLWVYILVLNKQCDWWMIWSAPLENNQWKKNKGPEEWKIVSRCRVDQLTGGEGKRTRRKSTRYHTYSIYTSIVVS